MRVRLDVMLSNMRIAVAIFSLALAAGIPSPSLAQTDEQRVLDTEDEYVAAEVNRDEATLRRLIDDRFVFNTSTGVTSGKEELIQSILTMNMVGQTVRERTVLIEGNIAIVFATADLRFAAEEGPETLSSLRYTATYVKRDGQWRMLALQMQQRKPE